MATRRVIGSVLHNFLNTYTSRYTAWDGYWLFGFLVENLTTLEIDLLKPPVGKATAPLMMATSIATAKFGDQLGKAIFPKARLRSAILTIERSTSPERLTVSHPGQVIKLRFRVVAMLDNGKQSEATHEILVAPHNSQIEQRSVAGA